MHAPRLKQMSAHAVRNLIIDQLIAGLYPIGAKLPTSRELALTLGAHRNTVAKAFQQLAELGLVTVRQGRGTYVVSLPDEAANGEPPPMLSQVRQQLTAGIATARRLGLPEPELRAMLEQAVARVYGNGRRGLFVECNVGDAETGVADIETLTGFRLTPMLLDVFGRDAARAATGYDVIVTILSHVKEVTDATAAAGSAAPVIGVYTLPDEAALSELAQIAPGAKVGIIVDFPAGVARFTNQINAVTTVETIGLVSPADAEIVALSGAVDVIVCNRSRAGHVARLGLPVPVIELRFHVSRQSTARVAEALIAADFGRAAPGAAGANTISGASGGDRARPHGPLIVPRGAT